MNEYKSSLCESYRDFAFIFDKDLGVYVVSLEPVDVNTVDTVFINVTDENKKDSIDDVINYVDDYYNSNEEVVEDLKEDVEEYLENEDSLKTLYGDLFIVELVRANDGEKEFVEFNDINSAQEYIDKIKIDNDEFFSKATLLDESNQVLDSWVYNSDDSVEEFENEEVIEEDLVELVDDNTDEIDDNSELVANNPIEVVEEIPMPDGFELVVTTDDTPVIDDSGEEAAIVVSNSEWANLIIDAYNSASIFVNNLKMLHWLAKGETFDSMHSAIDSYISIANYNLDFLAELLIELDVNPNNPITAQASDISILTGTEIEQDYFGSIVSNIDSYVCKLVCARNTDNLAQDIVSEFDSIIRYWNKENNYKNKRRQLV